jgi:hypothetical protein
VETEVEEEAPAKKRGRTSKGTPKALILAADPPNENSKWVNKYGFSTPHTEKSSEAA